MISYFYHNLEIDVGNDFKDESEVKSSLLEDGFNSDSSSPSDSYSYGGSG